MNKFGLWLPHATRPERWVFIEHGRVCDYWDKAEEEKQAEHSNSYELRLYPKWKATIPNPVMVSLPEPPCSCELCEKMEGRNELDKDDNTDCGM